MKKYLVKGRYTSEGTKGLIQEGGSSRRRSIEKMLAEMDGKVESFYYGFGEEDVYLIVELPDDISGTAVILKVNATGMVRISMTPLFSPEDIDEASKKTVHYMAPGVR